MSYNSRVYRILIASPSDVEEEREIAVRVIQEWNDLYSFSRKVTLLPLRWETHTAPEYGTRPQEVINRTIVDQSDLLVGVFWTRIGSPTGKADSGTLEEIERVGDAGKPIMLYFSKVGIDPDRIDLEQIDKLKQFKTKTYPKGLVESYKSIIEFRDKFSKQLELRVRDLQRNEEIGKIPLSLHFLSVIKGELIGNYPKITVDRPIVTNFESVPEEKREIVRKATVAHIKENVAVPVGLAIENSSSSGVRNLYVELEFQSSTDASTLSESPLDALGKSGIGSWFRLFNMKLSQGTESKITKFDSEKLQETEKGWKLTFDWEALQPQRTRVIKPILHFSSKGSAQLSVKAKIFADSFPEPMLLDACMDITINDKDSKLEEVLPDWKDTLFSEGTEK